MSNKTIGVRSLISRFRQGRFNNLSEIDEAIDLVVAELEQARVDLRAMYIKRAACLHSYKPATFSIQKRLFGLVRVNERHCENCSDSESYQEDMDGSGNDRPIWAKDALQRYYL